MKLEEALKWLDKGKKISENSSDVTTYLVKGSDGQIHEYEFGGRGELLSPLLSEVKKESNRWYVVSEDFIKRLRKASNYLERHGWYHNTDTVLLKHYKLGFIYNYIDARIDLKDLSCSLSLINIDGHTPWAYIFPADKLKDKKDLYDVKVAFKKKKKDFEFVRDLLYTGSALGIVKYDKEYADEDTKIC